MYGELPAVHEANNTVQGGDITIDDHDKREYVLYLNDIGLFRGAPDVWFDSEVLYKILTYVLPYLLFPILIHSKA